MAKARTLTIRTSFTEADENETLDDLRRNAVAGVAAVALAFGDAKDAGDGWVQSVIARAVHTVEPPGHFFVPSAVLPYHPCIFAAKGLAALIKTGGNRQKEKEVLLSLAAHPFEQVSETALAEAMGCWDIDARFGWAALNLGIALSVGKWNPERISAYGYDHSSNPAHVAKAIASAIKHLSAKKPSADVSKIPSPWTKIPGADADAPQRLTEWGCAHRMSFCAGISSRAFCAIFRFNTSSPTRCARRRSWPSAKGWWIGPYSASTRPGLATRNAKAVVMTTRQTC